MTTKDEAEMAGGEADASERLTFSLPPEAFAALQAALDAPVAPNPRLAETLRRAPPWEG